MELFFFNHKVSCNIWVDPKTIDFRYRVALCFMEKPIKICQQLYKVLIEKKRTLKKRSLDMNQSLLSEATGKIIEIIRAQHNSR